MPFDDAQADKTAIAATATIITAYFFIFIRFSFYVVKLVFFVTNDTADNYFFENYFDKKVSAAVSITKLNSCLCGDVQNCLNIGSCELHKASGGSVNAHLFG